MTWLRTDADGFDGVLGLRPEARAMLFHVDCRNWYAPWYRPSALRAWYPPAVSDSWARVHLKNGSCDGAYEDGAAAGSGAGGT